MSMSLSLMLLINNRKPPRLSAAPMLNKQEDAYKFSIVNNGITSLRTATQAVAPFLSIHVQCCQKWHHCMGEFLKRFKRLLRVHPIS